MLNQFSFGRSVAVIPSEFKQVLDEAMRNGVQPDLSDEQGELCTQIYGIAPGVVEAYASPAARDARLGRYAGNVEFVPATYNELATAGLTASNVAVGPRIGEPGFEEVLRAIVDDVAVGFLESGEETVAIVVGRVSYIVDRTGGVIGWTPVYGEGPSDAVCRATAAWLRQEFGPRLNRDQELAASETSDD
jgi:hypothetical protein